MYQKETRSVIAIASIFAFRMLGLFMILPIFALAADNYTGSTESLVGFALGAYGLTQACLQIPFGTLSDRFGRKPLIALGLVLFGAGSIIAAVSHSITGLIIGRALQGTGAIGSTLLALIADLTKVENRSKAMAMVGMTIGASFMLAIPMGSLLYSKFQLSGIFWFTAGLAATGIMMLLFVVPTPKSEIHHADTQPALALIKSTLKNAQLLRLDLSIFCLHAILMAFFVVLPIILERYIGLTESRLWVLYCPVLVAAFMLMVPLLIASDKKHKSKEIMLMAISLLGLSMIALYLTHSSFTITALILTLFFAAFSFLEATLPSLISKIAATNSKGTALGIYSTAQFLGIFFGGAAAGILLEQLGIPAVLLFCAGLAAFFFVVVLTLPKIAHLGSITLPLDNFSENNALPLRKFLLEQEGVQEATIIVDECIAYLKVDITIVDHPKLIKLTKGFMLGS